MDSRLERISTIFAEALERSGAEREQYLDEACEGDAALRAEVESLLLADAEEHAALGGSGSDPVIASVASPPPDSFRERIGSFELIRELGRGGQGVVYLAEDTRLHRKVALKVLSVPHSVATSFRERFKREAEAASKLDHAAICPVYEVGEADGVPYIAMRYIEGESLANHIEAARKKSRSNLPSSITVASDAGQTQASMTSGRRFEDVVRIIGRCARALHAAHEVGLIHRDVKPGNIMVTAEGDPMILDFGLARDVDSDVHTLTQSGQLVGTPAYMAPEQLDPSFGEIGRRADVYALGVTLYECLTLQRPFEGATHEQLFLRIMHDEPTPPQRINPRIPLDLRVILQTALEKNQDRRYQSAEALADDLRRWRRHEPISARPASMARRVGKWAKRRPGRAVAVVCASLALVGIGGLLTAQRITKRNEVRTHLRAADGALRAGDTAAALAAVDQALGVDPDSVDALRARKRAETAAADALARARRAAALETAATARDDAAKARREMVEVRKQLNRLRVATAKLRNECQSRFVPPWQRAKLARAERQITESERTLERLSIEARTQLERAERAEAPHFEAGMSPETRKAIVENAILRFREALATDTGIEAAKAEVRRYDRGMQHEAELLGHGRLAITVEPADAEVFLLRYESYETLRPDEAVVPRLVPVPTNGLGRVELPWRETCDFRAGDPVVKIRSVTPGSLAAKAGLSVGDFVLRLNGKRLGGTLVVTSVLEDGPAEEAGVELLDLVTSIDDRPARQWYWFDLAGRNPPVRTMVVGGKTLRVAPKRSEALTFGMRITPPRSIGSTRAPAPMTFTCLKNGELIDVRVEKGQRLGISAHGVDGYPLILRPDNRIANDGKTTVEPGSYLLVARAEGYDTQRYPVVVKRGAEVAAKIELLPEGDRPPGLIYIPPGPFIYGADQHDDAAAQKRIVDLDGFFITKYEISFGSWLPFANGEWAEKQRSEQRSNAYLPRQNDDPTKLMTKTVLGKWAIRFGGSQTPVLAISRDDALAFVKRANVLLEQQESPYRWDLPTEEEWEKAARGVDGRIYPWGNRFDHSLTMGKYFLEGELSLGHGNGIAYGDVSPYGVHDMGGSRKEMTSTNLGGMGNHIVRGGSCVDVSAREFQIVSRRGSGNTETSAAIGFRMVLRRIE